MVTPSPEGNPEIVQERWTRTSEIFHAALDLDGEERSHFLQRVCGGDASMQDEVLALLAADSKAGSYMESPLIPLVSGDDSALSSGEILCGRFRVLRALGEGGMGQVFEAHDEELNVRVALKIIRPDIALSPEALARFRQEVRLARRITHRNVCRTFDLERDNRLNAHAGVQTQIVFLTMEYLEGETLDSHIKRQGSLPRAQAMGIALQIAEALEAAHALGVIHRDVKPANVMLVPEGKKAVRAVVMDFGLARSESLPLAKGMAASSMTVTGVPMGTLSYMAPEQLEGKTVSAATDVYAFGLILFEMVTGRRAFPSDDLLSGLARRLTGPAPTAPEAGSARNWSRTIEGCLQVDPKKRFASLREAMSVLQGDRRPRRWMRNASSRRGRFARIAIFVFAVMSLLVAGIRLYEKSATSKVAPGAVVYLAPLQNGTGEIPLSALTELLQSGLAQSAQINLLKQERVGEILQEMRQPATGAISEMMAREIGMRGGAARVVFASVRGGNGSYALDLDVQEPDNAPQRYRHHWTKSFAWHSEQPGSGTIPPELLSAVRDASDWVRLEVGESGNDIARLNVPPQDVTTGNWAALQDFANAQTLLAERNKDGAIRMLESATGKDPHFALAYAELADNLMSEFRSGESLAAYNKAIAFEQEGRLSSRERYFILGTHASDTGNFQDAIEAFKNYTDLYQNDYLGWFYLAYPLIEEGRSEAAIVSLNRSFRLHEAGNTKAMMAIAAMVAGDLEDARSYAKEATALGSKDEGLYTSGMEAFLDGEYDAAFRDFVQLRNGGTQVYRVFGYSLAARLLAERGRWPEARNILAQGIEESRKAGDAGDAAGMMLDGAVIACRLREFDTCFTALDAAKEEQLDPVHLATVCTALEEAVEDDDANVRAQAARRLKGLLAEARRTEEGPLMRITTLRMDAEVKLAAHNWEGAVQSFRAADKLDAATVDRWYLGRGLAIAADHEINGIVASKLRSQSAAAYRRTLDHPAYPWHEPWQYSPGLLADEMQDYLRLCPRVPEEAASCSTEAERYRALRGENKAM
jgi:tetratricopeptide (TPR) repeat protein